MARQKFKVSTTLRNKTFEDRVGEGENADKQLGTEDS